MAVNLCYLHRGGPEGKSCGVRSASCCVLSPTSDLRTRVGAAPGQVSTPPYDGRAVLMRSGSPSSRARLQAVVVLAVSALILAGVIVATEVFGLSVRTTYGSGINNSLGSQVVRDFLVDQDAEAAALSKSDEALLTNRLSDSAISDVIQQIHTQAEAGGSPAVTFQPSSITVLRAQDPSDPTLLVELQEEGTKTVTTTAGSNSAPTQDAISFHGDFWLRLNSGRYTIADQNIQIEPISYMPQIALALVGLVWVGLATVLVRRTRATPAAEPAPGLPALPGPAVESPLAHEGSGPPARVVVRTFGGLQVLQDGKDWAADLNARSVMGFVWRRVLLAAVQDRMATITRDEVSRQANPGFDRETQLKRLRNLLHQGLRELPEPLRSRIVVEPQVLRFELDDCAVDAVELLVASADHAGRAVVSQAQAVRIKSVVEASRGLFMPEFETVEDLATDHHPTCTELIRGLREQLTTKRIDLILLLANTFLEDKRPGEAVALLEPVMRDQPSRNDLVERLATAYRASGRETEARGLAQLNR